MLTSWYSLNMVQVSTMIVHKLNPIIFLLNNCGYTIEQMIHKGPYNKINNWNYSKIVDIFNPHNHDKEIQALGFQVKVNYKMIIFLPKII